MGAITQAVVSALTAAVMLAAAHDAAGQQQKREREQVQQRTQERAGKREIIPGSELMTPAEREAYRRRYAAAKTDDERAIEEVLDGMYRAVWAKDYAAFASYHVQADYARRWAWWMPSTLVVKEGWEAISARIRQVMSDPRMPDGIDATVRRDNVNLRIMGDMAWVTFEQATPSTDGWSLGVGGYSREMRVLERHGGE